MSKVLSPNLIRAKNMLGGDQPWLILVQFHLSSETTFYLVSNTENITFQGQEYTAFPLKIELPTQSSNGEIPSVKLALGNATRVLQSYMEELNGAVGSKITLLIVNAGLLSEDYAELTLDFDITASECDAEWVSVTLGAPNPLNRRFPVNKYMATSCMWQFKGAECAYVGVETECPRNLSGCIARNNTARFGGFPGLQPGGIRFV